jgi:probable HAF family extracellular repeat protein
MRLHGKLAIGVGTLIALTVPAGPATAAPHLYKTTDLGTLGGPYSAAYAVNQAGDVVGQSQDAKGALRPFLWRHGRMTDLGVLDQTVPYGVATGINNHDWVVGSSDESLQTKHKVPPCRRAIRQDPVVST